jgi:hypothetical protein
MKKQEVSLQDIVEFTEKYYYIVEQKYGNSKHHTHTPYIYICDEPVQDDIKGEYCFLFNEITVYIQNIHSHEELVRVLIHEYQHYLQSPSWMTRYYKMGHTYDTHPYEVAAYKEEENWYNIWKQAS